MTCRSCEVRVSRALRALPGVTAASASARAGTATLTLGPSRHDAALSDRQARQGGRDVEERAEVVLRDLGYELGSGGRRWLSRDRGVWRDVVVAVLAVLAVAAVVRATGLSAPTVAEGNGSLLVVALVGLAAGVSTCMALVGGLVLGVSARAADRGRQAVVSAALAFQAGRVLGFAVLGALVGWFGSVLGLPPAFWTAATIVAGLVMLLLGVSLSGTSPRLAGAGVALPSSLARFTERVPSTGPLGPAVLGAATFVLPCGFTQAVQVYAMSTGSPARAAAILATFALGTSPGLLAAAALPALVPAGARDRALRVVGVVVVAFGLVTLGGAATSAGLARAGSGDSAVALAPLVDGVQVVTTTVDGDGYSPRVAAVRAGVPIRWVLDSRTPFTCASQLRAASLGHPEVALRRAVTELAVAPLAPGTYRYACAMGMFSGRVVVRDAPSS